MSDPTDAILIKLSKTLLIGGLATETQFLRDLEFDLGNVQERADYAMCELEKTVNDPKDFDDSDLHTAQADIMSLRSKIYYSRSAVSEMTEKLDKFDEQTVDDLYPIFPMARNHGEKGRE